MSGAGGGSRCSCYCFGKTSNRHSFQRIFSKGGVRESDVFSVVEHLFENRSDMRMCSAMCDRLSKLFAKDPGSVEFYLPSLCALMIGETRIPPLEEFVLNSCEVSVHFALKVYWHLQASLDEVPRESSQAMRLMFCVQSAVVNRKFSLVPSDSAQYFRDLVHDQSSSEPSSLRSSLIPDDFIHETVSSFLGPPDTRYASLRKNMAPLTEHLIPPPCTPPSESGSILSGHDHFATPKEHFESFDDPNDFMGRVKSRLSAYSSTGQPTVRGSVEVGLMQMEQALAPHNEHKLLDKVKALATARVMQHRRNRLAFFSQELKFITQLTDIAEDLRLSPRETRETTLKQALSRLQSTLPPSVYVPLCSSQTQFARIVRIPVEEVKVFSTHTRAPYMIVLEVIRSSNTCAVPESHFALSKRKIRKAVPPSDAGDSEFDSQSYQEPQLVDFNCPMSIDPSKPLCNSAGTRSSRGEPHLPVRASLPLPAKHKAVSVSEAGSDDAFSIEMSSHSTATDATSEGIEGVEAEDQPCELSEISRSGGVENLSESAINKLRESFPHDISLDLYSENHRLTFGCESFAEKRNRLRALSPYGREEGWDITSVIVKSFDDLRQEMFAMQLIEAFFDVVTAAGVPVFIKPYKILSTSATTGILETIRDATSLDALKKSPGYTTLAAHFINTYGKDTPEYHKAKKNFAESLAGYSILCYVLQIKDRHNGNILLNHVGHLVHIDFGFFLSSSPGGVNFEASPFKLTAEYMEVLGGKDSSLYKYYVNLCIRCFLVVREKAQQFVMLLEITMPTSQFGCFKAGRRTIDNFCARLELDKSTEEVIQVVLGLVREARDNWYTKQYDLFQKLTNGIKP